MNKDAIDKLEQMITAAGQRLPETDNPKAILPKDMQLVDLERYQARPYWLKGSFQTNRVQSFIDYVRAHKEDRTHIFIDSRSMVAVAALDHHDVGEKTGKPVTGWGDHTAILKMQQTPEWSALVGNSKATGITFTQRGLLDFIADWKQFLNFFRDAEGNVDIATSVVYQSIQKLTVSQSKVTTHEDRQYKASSSSMEEIDVQGVDVNLPELMRMKCSTHVDLEPITAECRLMVLTGEKPTLAYRINALDSIEDAAAKDFGSQITKGLDKLPIWLGSFTRA